jgi:hypothetical protein
MFTNHWDPTEVIWCPQITPMGSQRLTEMSTGNIKKMFLGNNMRPMRAADNLTAIYEQPIAVVERSRARTVFARSNTAIVGSNPT